VGYPAGQQGACHGVVCDVGNGDDFQPAGETVDCSMCSLLMLGGGPRGPRGRAENGLPAG
jgi:hypothetical protein